MKFSPFMAGRRLFSLYRKLISIWVDDSEITQDVYDDFLVGENSEGTDDSGQPIIKILGNGLATVKNADAFRQSVSNPLDEDSYKDPLWNKYIVENIVEPKIDNGDVPPGGGGIIGGGGVVLNPPVKRIV